MNRPMNAEHADRIAYDRPFREKVKGKLKARFQLGPDGAPLFEPDDEDPTLRHYPIDVFLESPRAEEIEGVTYCVDDPTFWDPKGYSEDVDNDFREVVETYGEVPIDVTVQIGSHEYRQRAWLSNMLENGHSGDFTPAVRDAIERVKSH